MRSEGVRSNACGSFQLHALTCWFLFEHVALLPACTSPGALVLVVVDISTQQWHAYAWQFEDCLSTPSLLPTNCTHCCKTISMR